MKPLLLALCAFAVAPLAHATKFSNQFAEFELPAKWQCNLEGAEWVCQSTDEARKREAIIVLAAKLKGDLDSLDRYQQYLQGPRIFTAPNGKSVTSNPKYTRVSQLNQHPWVDSLHLESEVPGFYTRYLATVKQDIAVLVTYSINKTKYNDYQAQFDEMVKSMKVFRKAGAGLNQAGNGTLFQANSNIMNGSGLFNPTSGPSEAPKVAEAPKKKAEGSNGDMMMLLLAAAAVGGFMIYKKRKGGGA